MGIFEEIEEMQKDLGRLDVDIKRLDLKKQKEINELEEKKKDAERKYDDKISIIETSKKRYLKPLEERFKKISDASIFEVNLIGEALSKLISTIEGENYSFSKVNYKEKVTYLSLPYVSPVERNFIKYLLIPSDNKIENYEESYVDGLEKSKFGIDDNVVVLLSEKIGPFSDKDKINEVMFYSKKGCKNVNFKEFDYVYDFINNIIEYRLKKESNEITKEEIENLLSQYIKVLNKDVSLVKKYEGRNLKNGK